MAWSYPTYEANLHGFRAPNADFAARGLSVHADGIQVKLSILAPDNRSPKLAHGTTSLSYLKPITQSKRSSLRSLQEKPAMSLRCRFEMVVTSTSNSSSGWAALS